MPFGSWPDLVKWGRSELSPRFLGHGRVWKSMLYGGNVPLLPSVRFPCSRLHQVWPRALTRSNPWSKCADITRGSGRSMGVVHTNAAPHGARPLAFRLTLPHTGVPGAHGGQSPECV